MTRKRFNRNAVCSSENYSASRDSHLSMLKEKHHHFNQMILNGEITFDTPIFKEGKPTSKFKTIKVFGKDITITIEEFETHCAHLSL